MQNRIDYEGLQNWRQKRTKKLLSQKDFFDSLQINRFSRFPIVKLTLGHPQEQVINSKNL